MFELTITTGNAAFADDPGELPRILRSVAERVEREDWTGIGPDGAPYILIRDLNGNRVGTASLLPDDE